MLLVDSHCHFDLLQLSPEEDLAAVIHHARQQGVGYFLNVSVTISDFPVILKQVEAYSDIASASVGLHPNEDETVDTDQLIMLGQHSKVVAIGETGLDYYRSVPESPWQAERFRAHIQAAKHLKKPLIIHTRAAKFDTLRIMREEKADEIGGVMHCFTEDWDMARQALDMNFYISFSGIVTFKNAKTIQEVAKRVPADRILIETDAPYLAPVPYRGQSNQPAFLRETAQFLAELRQQSLDYLAEHTTANFFKLFTGATRPHV